MKQRFNINMIFYYISFLLLLVAMVSIISLFQLGGAIDVILKENLPSVLSGEKMSESLVRIHLLIMPKQGSEFEEHRVEIDNRMHDYAEGLVIAKNNITIGGEEEIIAEIDATFRKYRERISTIKQPNFDSDTVQELTDLFNRNSAAIKKLISVNNQAIIRADENAKNIAKSRSIWMIFLALIGFVSIFYLIRTIQRNFSEPIGEMLVKLQRISFGDQNLRLSKRQGDLGSLADHINNLLDSRATAQSNTINFAFEQRDMLSALVDINPYPFFLYDLGYHIIISNQSARNILKKGADNKLEQKLAEVAQKNEPAEITINDITYHLKASILRDRAFNKIGYTIVLVKYRE